MSTWTTIYGGRVDGDPVVAATQPFYDAASHARTTGQNIDYVSDEFRQIRFGDSDGFRGDTASALADKAAEWQAKIDPTGEIFKDVATILDSHAEQLSALRSQATTSAGKALAVWKLKNAADARAAQADQSIAGASQEVSSAQRTVDSIRYQINALVPGSPDTAILLPNLQYKEHVWQETLRERDVRLQNLHGDKGAAESESRAHAAELETWLSGARQDSWHSLRRREQELNDSTAQKIKSVDLRGAADPNLISQWLDEFGDFVRSAVSTIAHIVDAALKVLVDVVKIVLIAIAIIAIAIIVIAAIVAVIYLVAVVVAYVAATAAVVASVVVQVAVRVIASVIVRQILRMAIRQALKHLMMSTLKDVALHGLAEIQGWMNRHVFNDAPTPRTSLKTDSFAGTVLNRNRSDPAGKSTYQANQVFRELEEDAENAGHQANGVEPVSVTTSDGVWTRLSQTDISKLGIDVRLLDESAGMQAVIYQNASGDIVVAYAGSIGIDKVLSDPGEWGKDWLGGDAFDTMVGAFAAPFPTQQRQATELARAVAGAVRPDHDVVFTGHSLGGDLAAQSAMVTGSPAVTWNAKGVNTNDLVATGLTDEAIRTQAPQLILNYEVKGEVLSTLQNDTSLPNALGTSVQVPPVDSSASAFDKHDLNQFCNVEDFHGVLLDASGRRAAVGAAL